MKKIAKLPETSIHYETIEEKINSIKQAEDKKQEIDSKIQHGKHDLKKLEQKISEQNQKQKVDGNEFNSEGKINYDVINVPNKQSGYKNKQIDVDWDNVSFGNHFIVVRHAGVTLEKHQLNQSRQSFNDIKSHYKFKNAPKLKLEIEGRRISSILNQEVLFLLHKFFSERRFEI